MPSKHKHLPRLAHRDDSVEVYVGDALTFLQSLPRSSAHVILLDPPFNLGKRYSSRVRDALTLDEYRSWIFAILHEAIQVLSDGGALYLYHVPSWAIEFGHYLGSHLTFRHWIAVSMKNGFVRGQRLYPAHYALLFYTKGAPAVFRRPKLPVEYCKCGKTRKDYGGYLPIVRDKGLNLSDVWDDVSPVRHRNRKRRTANELPAKLTDRMIAISGGPELLYVDPFAGGGSGVLSAVAAGMRVKACDIVARNAALQIRALQSRP